MKFGNKVLLAKNCVRVMVMCPELTEEIKARIGEDPILDEFWDRKTEDLVFIDAFNNSVEKGYFGPLSILGRKINRLSEAKAIIFMAGFTKDPVSTLLYSVINTFIDDGTISPVVIFESSPGHFVKTKDHLERHRCFMIDQMED